MQIEIPPHVTKRIENIAKMKGLAVEDVTSDLVNTAFVKAISSFESDRNTHMTFVTSAYIKSRISSIARQNNTSASLFIHEVLAKEVSRYE